MTPLLEDWRHRPTHRRVWALALPMILSNVSVPLVALVDTAVIGHLPEPHMLGAVAVGGALYGLLVWGFGFLRMSTTGFAAQAVGRGDGTGLRQVLLQGLLLALAFAALLGLLALPFSQAALHLMQPSGALQGTTEAFFHQRLWGLPAALVSYALIGWFLGAQNARAPLLILLVTNALNIVLNVWFVVGLDWGVLGSARASVIAEWAAALLGLALTRPALRAHPGRLPWARLKQWSQWRPLMGVNRDIFIRSLVLQGVMFMVTVQGARLGDVTVAANALLLNGLVLTAQALDGFAHAVEALCGRAIGQRDRLALRRSLVVAGGWSLLVSIVFAALFAVAGPLFVDLQTNMPAVRTQALIYLPYLAWLPLVAVWSYLLDGLFIGATRGREMRNAMLLSALLAIPLAWLAQGWGNHGLWISFLGFMAMRAAVLASVAWRMDRRGEWA